MSTILVSILGVMHSSVPNFLFLKEMEGRYNELVFVTTPEVDKAYRGEYLETALQVEEGSVIYIPIDGNDYKASLERLKEKWSVHEDDKYIVNLTGGTKMMSLAVHDYFSQLDSSFYYVPIGKNTYYNMSTGEWMPLRYRASLKEYFMLYGIWFDSIKESSFKHSKEEAYGIFNEVRKHRFYLTPRLKDAQEAKSAELRRYYGGEWFEQFSYYKLKDTFKLRNEDIALSLKIFRKENDPANDNELDVAFMYENLLHVVECKVTMFGAPGRSPRDVVEEYLYKLAAVSKDFGLQVSSYLFTLHQMQKFSPNERQGFSKRCHILGIEGIVSGGMFTDLKGSLYNKQALQP